MAEQTKNHGRRSNIINLGSYGEPCTLLYLSFMRPSLYVSNASISPSCIPLSISHAPSFYPSNASLLLSLSCVCRYLSCVPLYHSHMRLSLSLMRPPSLSISLAPFFLSHASLSLYFYLMILSLSNALFSITLASLSISHTSLSLSL